MAPQPVLLMDQEERLSRFGVLCTGPTRRDSHGVIIEQDGILFGGGEWEAGGEYAQKLTVKNVTTKMKKLKYRLPSTRYFSLAFPETIELSPGMSVEIDVIFRPIKEEIYEDTIYFKLQELPVGTVISDAPIRGFHVPVRALLPTLQCRVPDDVDMGLCPTQETSERTFYIENTGEVPAPFRWTTPEPFSLYPAEGLLDVGESQLITCSLHPEQASVFVSRATCEVGRGINCFRPQPVIETKLSAVGKYVHISISDDRVDFGDVLAGALITEETTREIVISNRSVVHARVEVCRVERDCEPVFAVHPTSLIVPPKSELPVQIQFHARSAGTYTAEHLEFVTPGGNRPRLLLTGSSVAPVVRISKQEDPYAKGFGVSTSINFGSIPVGKKCDRAVFLSNDSDRPLHFQFVCDHGGVFTLSKYRGVLPAKLEIPVKFTFSPDRPINYYKRLFLIVEHRLPLFVDLLGTSHISAKGETKEQRPAPLRHAHVQAARNRQAAGLGRAGPDELEEMHAEFQERAPSSEERLLFARIGASGHDDVLLTTHTQHPVTRSGEATRSAVQVAHDFFEEYSQSELKEVQVSTSSLDFGLKATGQSGRRTVTVTNTTRAKISVAWTPCPLVEAEGQESKADFSVSPAYADIAKGETQDFTVKFHPRCSNCYSSIALEAQVFFKSQRSFRLVNDAVLAPPWRLEVHAAGHSFTGEQFAPALSCEPKERHFPGTHVGDAGYQCVTLRNPTNLPALFRVEPDPVRAFALRPSQGLIPPGGFQLLVARFQPKEEQVYRHRVKLVVNGEECDGPLLWGAGQIPRCVMVGCDEVTNPETGAGSVTFSPTCVGLASRRTFKVHNCSRVPLVFDAVLPSRALETFSLKPKAGVLRGNESTEVTVTFAPANRGLKKTKLVVAVRPLAGPPPSSKRDARQLGNAAPAKILQKVVARLIAPASSGVVSFDPPLLEYPTLLVNTTSSKALVILNASDCAIKYSMDYVSRKRAFAVGEQPPEGATIKRELLRVPSSGRTERILIDEPTGLIQARQRKRVKVTFQPDAAGEFEFACVCKVHAVDDQGEKIALDPAQAALLTLGEEARDVELVRGADPFSETIERDVTKQSKALPLTCVVKGSASFPTILVRDVRVEGAKLGCATQNMWAHFSLSALNQALLTPLKRSEVLFNLESSPNLQLVPRIPLKFVPEPLGNPPQVVLIEIRNPGLLPTTFSVHLPNEREIELEQWADEGEANADEVKVNKIIDELKCFDISPRKATLMPGESATLRLAYVFSSREFDGKHTLPVLLRVAQGKQLWLDLEGRTLAPREPYLVLPKDPMTNELALHPVAVGTRPEQAPLQILEVMNVGNSPLEYAVEYAPPSLRGDSDIETDVELLRVENPTGHVPAFGSADIRMRFLPLQAASYESAFKIRYKYGDRGSTRHGELDALLTCAGYDPRDASQDPHKGGKVPEGSTSTNYEYQIVEAPAQPAVLSRECVDYGRVAQRAHVIRMVTLRAPKALEAEGRPPIYEFQWEAAHDLIEKGILGVEPLSGRILPGGVAVCRVSLKADCEPRVVDASLLVLVKEAAPTPLHGRRSRPTSPVNERPLTGVSMAGSSAIRYESDPAHRSLITRCTVSRERSLTQTTLPGSRLPMMPTSGTAVAPPPLGAPPPPDLPGSASSTRGPPGPPRSASTAAMLSTFGDQVPDQGTLQSGGSVVGCASACFLRLRVRGEVVHESQHIALHDGHTELDDLYIPRPLAYIPPSSTLEDDPFASSDSSSDDEEEELSGEELKNEMERCRREVIRRTMGDIIKATFDLHEVRSVFRMLPEKPVIPYYVEVRPHASVLERMTRDLRPYVSDDSISLGDVRQAFLDVGLKATIVESRDFMKMLKESASDTVQVEDFFTTLSAQVSHAVVRALDDRDYAEKIKIRDERREVRMQKQAPKEWWAASMLANAYRGKKAREAATYKKWSFSHEGALLIKYSIVLQQKYRCYQARKLLKRKAAERLDRTARRLLGDAAFQKMVFGAVEGTLLNLVQEALHHEFDLTAPPVQRVMPGEE